MLLNSHVFQRELDPANASRDRQIYPVIGPGLEPGTSELTLKVKDRLPLHARVEINNQTTPGTPDSRITFNSQYDNLWQLEHQIGVQLFVLAGELWQRERLIIFRRWTSRSSPITAPITGCRWAGRLRCSSRLTAARAVSATTKSRTSSSCRRRPAGRS